MGIEAALTTALVNIGASAAVAGAIVAVAQFAAITAVSGYLAKRSSAVDPGMASRAITKRGTVEPQQKVYGEALVGGTLAFLNVAGDKNKDLWGVHVLAGHEVDSITDVWLDDRVILNSEINGGAAAGGDVTTGTFGPKSGNTVVRVTKYLGTSTQTADSTLSTAFTNWTSAHRLRGLAYITTRFKLWGKTEKLWESGEPTNVRAIVRGAKIYDPRLDSTMVIDSTTSPWTYGSGTHRSDDSTTWAWSDNPALCVADFLMDSKFSPFPGGIDPTRIDWEAVATAADVCDTLVVVPPNESPINTEKRFTCNGTVYGTNTADDSLRQLLGSMNGNLVLSGGKYVIIAGGYQAPVDTLDEDDIVGPLGIRTALDSDERINTIKGTFVDPDRNYEPQETIEISVAAYVTRDNGDSLIDEIQLPFTNSWYMAQRICLKRLYEHNQQMTLQVPCNLRAARFRPGDRINVTVTERGWTPKIFKVLDWKLFDRGGNDVGVSLALREDDVVAYDDPAVSDYNFRSGAGDLNVADPQVRAGIDTIPRGIAYGEGSTSCQFRRNTSAAGSASPGEIQVKAGKFYLPDGTVRTLSSDGNVYTPWEIGVTPPDSTFYVIWGASNPTTRFANSPEYNFGDTNATGAGLFGAIYDRFDEKWYAVDNGNNETEFSPLLTDYVVARGSKSSLTISPDPGIDYLTSVVAQVNDPEATEGALAGTSLYRASDLSVLEDIDIRNDQLVTDAVGGFLNANADMRVPRRNEEGNLCPASWFGTNNKGDFGYVDETVRDVMKFDFQTDYVANTVVPVDPDKLYQVIIIARLTTVASPNVASADVRVAELDTDPGVGVKAVSNQSLSASPNAGEAEVGNHTRTVTVINNMLLTGSFTYYSDIYRPTYSAKWASLEIYSGSSGTGMQVELCGIRDLGNPVEIESRSTGKTLAATDFNNITRFTGTSNKTVTVSSDCLGASGRKWQGVREGSGTVSFISGGSPTVTFHSSGGTSIVTQGGSVLVTQLDETNFLLGGDV